MAKPFVETTTGVERTVVWLAVGLAMLNAVTAVLLLPRSPGFDDRTLYASVYAFEHYGRLFYPIYDMPLMIMHPPTKYWFVGLLVSAGVPVGWATASLFLLFFAMALAAIRACRFQVFQTLAAVFAISAAVTVCPFIAYAPENLTHGEVIGRLRPEDLVLLSWFGGVFWLETARRSEWRRAYLFLGGLNIALAASFHYFGLTAFAALAVYGLVLICERPRLRIRPLIPMAAGALVVIVPFVISIFPYRARVLELILSQQGESYPQTIAAVLRRHQADYWFLLEWAKTHLGNVWPQAGLLSVPAVLGIPPVFIGAGILLAFRSSRLLGAAALSVPLAVVMVAHQWIGYDLPEIAFYFLACGWLGAHFLDRLKKPAIRLAACAVFLVPLAIASPLVWDPSAVILMDDRNSPEVLRAVAREIVGPEATVGNGFYTVGEDRCVLGALPEEAGIDFVAEKEFNLHAAALHERYFDGRAKMAGFVMTPDAPSASTVFFTAKPLQPRGAAGFVVRDGVVRRFSAGTGWTFQMLSCRASADENPWVSPKPPALIAGYIPRVDHCVNNALKGLGVKESIASAYFRSTFPDGRIGPKALVPLLLDDATHALSADVLRRDCGCEAIESRRGRLAEVSRAELLANLAKTDRSIRFYANSADVVSGRSMARRFFGDQQP